MRRSAAFLLAALLPLPLSALDVSACTCDAARPEAMHVRACGLCREAEKQPADVPYFFLKDNNPRKPNRWLILPRAHLDGLRPLARMSARARVDLWTAAIDKARELWGDGWGLAINGDRVRTQCHAHIHIGKLLNGIHSGRFIVVRGASQIPTPAEDSGLWIHPAGGKLHVHLGEQTTETVLLR